MKIEKPEKCEKCGSDKIAIRKKTFASGVGCHIGWACLTPDRYGYHWAARDWIKHRDIENIEAILEIPLFS